MRFTIILILFLLCLTSKSIPTDTVKYIPKFTISTTPSIYTPTIAYIYKQESGGYQVTLVLPDVYYWTRNPDIVIKLIDYDSGMAISNKILYDSDKGDFLFVKPGHYLMIIFVVSHSSISFFKEDTCYVVELSRN